MRRSCSSFTGITVSEVTELRRQVRAAKGQHKVVKNTLAKRALKGTSFEPLSEHFTGATAVAYSARSGRAREGAHHVRQDHAGAAGQGGGRAGQGDQAGGGHRAGDAARQAGAATRSCCSC